MDRCVIASGGRRSARSKAAERGLGHGQGLRRRARPARRDPKGGGSRTTGGVKALARCASTHLHDSTVRRTALRGRPARRPARRDAGRITSAGQRRRRPRKAALRVAFPVPSVCRERSPMPRHRRHAPSCRGNGKRDPTCRGIVQGSTGIAPRAFPSLSSDIHRAAPVHGEKAGPVFPGGSDVSPSQRVARGFSSAKVDRDGNRWVVCSAQEQASVRSE